MDKGGKCNPIQILQQEQQIRLNKQKVQFEKNRQMLYQAHMGSQFDVLLAVEKTEMEGTQQQRNKKIKERINKFFFTYGHKHINVEYDYFRQRRQANYTDENTLPIANQLIIYGVDFLNTKEIKRKFVGLGIQIKWIDDSHCKIIFKNAEDAKKGLEMNIQHKGQNLIKLQDQDIQVPKCWFQLQPYFYLNIQRHLFSRYATNQENYASDKDHDYFIYQKAKKDFEKSLVNKQKYFSAMKKFQLIDQHHLRIKLNIRGRSQARSGGHSERTVDKFSQKRSFSRQQSSERYFQNYDSSHNRKSCRGSYNNWERRNQQRYQRSPHHYSRQRSRQRSRQKYENENDNLSIISEGRSHVHKNSLSIQNIEQSPIRQDQKQAEQDEGLSFILNEQQINSSKQIISQMANLSFNNCLGGTSFKKRKEQEQLSLDLNKIQMNSYLNNSQRNENLDLSIGVNDSFIKGNNNLNISINIQQPEIADINQSNLNLSMDLNLEPRLRQYNNHHNTSINIQQGNHTLDNHLNTSINIQQRANRANKKSVTQVVIDDD